MLKRLYVHNFRCLQNFTLELGEFSSLLLLGRNGAGKSTVAAALEVLQKLGRGATRAGELVRPADRMEARPEVPIRFEVEVSLEGRSYVYALAFDLPPGWHEMRVLAESLTVDGKTVLSRDLAGVRFIIGDSAVEATFAIDERLVTLTVIQEPVYDEPVAIFKKWLLRLLILRPVPSAFAGEYAQRMAPAIVPDAEGRDIGNWFTNLVAPSPATYTAIADYLRLLMPDFAEIKNPLAGGATRQLIFCFGQDSRRLELPLEALSDGEKCFFVYALTMATNASAEFGPILCFWDEPDNFLAPDEVSPATVALRSAFERRGQLIVTSHNPEAIRRFSDENTLYLARKSHFEPTVARSVAELRASGRFEGSLVSALLCGGLEA